MSEETVRKTVTLPGEVARRIEAMKWEERVSEGEILRRLVERGLRSEGSVLPPAAAPSRRPRKKAASAEPVPAVAPEPPKPPEEETVVMPDGWVRPKASRHVPTTAEWFAKVMENEREDLRKRREEREGKRQGDLLGEPSWSNEVPVDDGDEEPF